MTDFEAQFKKAFCQLSLFRSAASFAGNIITRVQIVNWADNSASEGQREFGTESFTLPNRCEEMVLEVILE